MNKQSDRSAFIRALCFITFGIGLLVTGYVLALATSGKTMVSSAFIGGGGILVVVTAFLGWCRRQ